MRWILYPFVDLNFTSVSNSVILFVFIQFSIASFYYFLIISYTFYLLYLLYTLSFIASCSPSFGTFRVTHRDIFARRFPARLFQYFLVKISSGTPTGFSRYLWDLVTHCNPAAPDFVCSFYYRRCWLCWLTLGCWLCQAQLLSVRSLHSLSSPSHLEH